MTLGEVVFLLMSAMVAVGAVGAVLSNSLIYAVFFLLLAMGGIGGLYIYLGAPFLAMMQILIYMGAVGVLLVFAVMLAGPFWRRPKERGPFLKGALGCLVGGVALVVFLKVVAHYPWGSAGPRASTPQAVGRAIMDHYTLAFELVSLLIVASIIGAIMLGVLSRREG